MKRRISELQVGVLTIVSLVILIAGMMWLKNMDLTRGDCTYRVDFSRVEGLRVGDRVQVRGIRMGEVSALEILDVAVRVDLKLDPAASLREDAVLTLGEKGIVGEVVIEIDPGSGQAVPEGHLFEGRTAGTIAAMTDAAGAALAEMRSLTRKVTELVDEVKEQGKVVETLTQANQTFDKIDGMVVENHRNVTLVLENMVATTDRLRSLLESGKIEETFEGTAVTMARTDSLMISLAESGRKLDRILTDLTEGDGSAALLLNDPMLYQRADSTLASLHRLTEAFRRNPKRFFRMNLVDF